MSEGRSFSSYNSGMSRLPKVYFREAFPAIVLALLAGRCNAQGLPDRMQQVVQPYVDAQMFMGNVLVARVGRVVFSNSYGMADLEWKVPISSYSIQHRFDDQAIHRRR